MNDLDVNNDNNDDELALGDLNDIFDSDPFGTGGAATSPTGSPRGAGQMSQPGSPGSAIPGSEAFRSVQYTCTPHDTSLPFVHRHGTAPRTPDTAHRGAVTEHHKYGTQPI